MGTALLALALAAAPAAAEEKIESFKTTLVEANAPLGEAAVSGVVESEPSDGTFTIETREGTTETVEVSPTTTYVRARPLAGEETSLPTLGNVVSGDYVGVSGNPSGPRVAATGIVISTPQAGAHPDLLTSFSLQSPGAPEAAENVIFDAPVGVFGNPRAAAQCTQADFTLDRCPPNSQVGLITVRANYEGSSQHLLGTAPIFSVVPQNEETARFAFVVPVLNIPIAIPLSVRTSSDYGLRFTVTDITQLTPLAGARMTFWGFPAAEAHDAQRFPKGSPGKPAGCPAEEGTGCISEPTEASIPDAPLTDNPTICTGEALTSRLEVQTYQDPGHPSIKEATYPPVEGCESEKFEPFLQAAPTTTATDSPSGLDIDLSAPQFETKAVSPSEIRSVMVTFPAGLTINPDAADGQTMCTNAEANFGSNEPANCPNPSKIGTFSIGTPALSERLEGALYIGEPEPGDQYRLFEIASGSGINAKLVGSLQPNPETGQVTAQFQNLPQAPFEDFRLHLFSGERALLASPNFCTVYTVSSRFTPWNSALPPQTSTQPFGLESGPYGSSCPGQIRPFNPGLEAGTTNATANAFSAFSLKLSREDGDQNLGHLNFTLPPGLTANLHGITYCPEANIAAAAQPLDAPSSRTRAAPLALKLAPPTWLQALAPTPSTPPARSTWLVPSRAHL